MMYAAMKVINETPLMSLADTQRIEVSQRIESVERFGPCDVGYGIVIQVVDAELESILKPSKNLLVVRERV